MQTAMTLRGGRVIDPSRGLDAVGDVYVADGRIAAEAAPGATVVDVSGLVVCPGFIDLHVHLREPGQTHKEDLRSGTWAAAAGGFTTVVAMPNTAPPIDTAERLAHVLAAAAGKAVVRVRQAAALTLGREGAVLTDAGALARAGAVLLTDDGSCIQSNGLMLEAMRRAAAAGVPVADHCEDESVSRRAAMNAGEVARRLGVSGQPSLAEELMVSRGILLCRETGCPIHIQHVSSRLSVEMVRAARRAGLPVTAEATPHHISLTEDACATHGADAKMAPPLRREADRQAVIAGLADGTLTALASDHAPHTAAEKAVGLEKAPFGIVGLEALVPVSLTELVHSGAMGLAQWVATLTSGPREILHLEAGTLRVGMPADVTLLDPGHEHTLRTASFRSRSRNCPYEGRRCRGRVAATLVGGVWVYSRLPGIAGLVP